MKAQQVIGRHGEDIARNALHQAGVEMVEKIGTPVLLSPVLSNKPNVFHVAWGEKVSGDHRGLLYGGQSVLAETKTILDRNLRYSDLREHQPERLRIHAEFGGLSLLVWVHSTGVYVMKFPIAGFVPGTSLAPHQAEALNVESLI